MIPSPPQNLRKPVAFYDTECYPNFWLLKFKTDTGIIYSFSLEFGETFSAYEKSRILTLFELFTVVSFNGIYYDVPMIMAALNGLDPTQLKILNDRIIVDGLKPWELGLPEWKPQDHIDIMQVLPGAGGQKQYAGRIHCKKMQDLPYDPATSLTDEQIEIVDAYCENDLDVLEQLYKACAPLLHQREALSARYGIDLRSKSDAQVAEAVLKHRCEQALGQKIYKPDIDWNFKFKFDPPDYLTYGLPQLQQIFNAVKSATFGIRPTGSFRGEDDEKGKCIVMPPEIEGLEVKINNTIYTMGVGGLHSQDGRAVYKADDEYILEDVDVAAYYPSLMLKAGAWPPALGETFLKEFAAIKDERIAAKELEKELKKKGFVGTVEYIEAKTANEGGKIMINGTFGKTGSPFSVLFAPKMLIQTTINGQLSLLMLIEWLEHYGIAVLSANTDGLLIRYHKSLADTVKYLIKEWEARTSLEMESTTYRAMYMRDVNNYFAVKTDGEVKRKGEYAKAGLVEKKNPDVEICSDAVAEFLAHGTNIAETIFNCRDIRKFVTIIKVSGGGVKLWGDGPMKNTLVRDMIHTLERNGWTKDGRKWRKGEVVTDPTSAYATCFAPQRPEYLGKVVRWYYGTNSPGQIVSASSGNNVSLSYGATPCMILPDTFPTDIDYMWYINKCEAILKDIGYYQF